MKNMTWADETVRVETHFAHTQQSHVRVHAFCVICLSLALNLRVPLIGDVSCLATEQSGPIVAMTTWQGYHHHGENRDEEREREREIESVRERAPPLKSVEILSSVQVGGWPLSRWQQRMLMNAKNRKLMLGNVVQHWILFWQNRLHSGRKCHDVLQLSLVTHSKADAEAAAQHVAGVQRASGLTSAGVITHPSPDSSPL